jgi:bacterioferritin-associated ferredoxin
VFVCHCRAVTDGTIRACIQGGACSVKDLGERCGAGTRCGGCVSLLSQLLAEATGANVGPLPDFNPCAA